MKGWHTLYHDNCIVIAWGGLINPYRKFQASGGLDVIVLRYGEKANGIGDKDYNEMIYDYYNNKEGYGG